MILPSVQLNGLCQARKLLDQLARRGHQASEPDEGPHDLDIDPHCNGRTEDAGEHGHAMFGESPGKITLAAAAGFEVAICDLKAVNSCCVS